MDTHIRSKYTEPSEIGIDLDNQRFLVWEKEREEIVVYNFNGKVRIHPKYVQMHNEQTLFKIKIRLGIL